MPTILCFSRVGKSEVDIFQSWVELRRRNPIIVAIFLAFFPDWDARHFWIWIGLWRRNRDFLVDYDNPRIASTLNLVNPKGVQRIPWGKNPRNLVVTLWRNSSGLRHLRRRAPVEMCKASARGDWPNGYTVGGCTTETYRLEGYSRVSLSLFLSFFLIAPDDRPRNAGNCDKSTKFHNLNMSSKYWGYDDQKMQARLHTCNLFSLVLTCFHLFSFVLTCLRPKAGSRCTVWLGWGVSHHDRAWSNK